MRFYQKKPVRHRVRPRALTLPLPSPDPPPAWNPFNRSTQRSSEQTQSSLLSKLPWEVRKQIWIYVFGGRSLYVRYGPRKLLVFDGECSFKDARERYGFRLTTTVENLGRKYHFNPGIFKHKHRYPYKPLDLVAPLMTCRKVFVPDQRPSASKTLLTSPHRYSEAIQLLYSHNVFFFINIDFVLQLSDATLPSRFTAIRSIVLDWRFTSRAFPLEELPSIEPAPHPHNHLSWSRVCDCIASVTQLEELQMHVRGPGISPVKDEYFELWLEPMGRIRPKRSYEVISHNKPLPTFVMGKRPFRFIYHDPWHNIWEILTDECNVVPMSPFL